MAGGGRRRTALVAAGVLLTVLVGCGDKESGASRPTGAVPLGDTRRRSHDRAGGRLPELAVDPPGPRSGPLVSADLLVFSQDTLTPGMVRRISAIEGVRDVEQLSMAQVSIENQALNLAAVDPATYRNYTPPEARSSRRSGTGSPRGSSRSRCG